jgi:mannose/fructose/N-acetylgalactosamine-specific phosphotransferase system component IIC
MKQRSRKFAGIFIILGLLFIYPAIASVIYEKFLTSMPVWILLSYFAIAGLLWAVPAGIVIKWMARPDNNIE